MQVRTFVVLVDWSRDTPAVPLSAQKKCGPENVEFEGSTAVCCKRRYRHA